MRSLMSTLVLVSLFVGSAVGQETPKTENPWKPLFQDLETMRAMNPAERTEFMQKRLDQFVDAWVTNLPAEQREEIQPLVNQLRTIRSLSPEERQNYLDQLESNRREALEALARERAAEFEKVLESYRQETSRLAKEELEKFLSYLPEDSRRNFNELIETMAKIQRLSPQERQTFLTKENLRIRRKIRTQVETYMDRFGLGQWNEVQPRRSTPDEFLPDQKAPTAPKSDDHDEEEFEQK